MRYQPSSVSAVILVGLFISAAASASEIRIISASNMREILTELTRPFEEASGHKLALAFSKAGAVAARVRGGEPGDLAVMHSAPMAELAHEGLVIGNRIVPLCHTAIGLIVKVGAAKPDISSEAALKSALLSARTVAFTDPDLGGTSGVYFAETLNRLGIAAAMAPKTRLVPRGPDVWTMVAHDGAALGANQISDLTPMPAGVEFVGILPHPYDQGVVMSAVMLAAAHEPVAASELLRFLASPTAASVIRSHGMEPY